jgi:hypothetical protein
MQIVAIKTEWLGWIGWANMPKSPRSYSSCVKVLEKKKRANPQPGERRHLSPFFLIISDSLWIYVRRDTGCVLFPASGRV